MTITFTDLPTETIQAALLTRGAATILIAGPSVHTLAPAQSYTLIYAWHLLNDARMFFPAYLMDDFGDRYSGPAVHAWLAENTYSQPRGDIFGLWDTGRADQCFARDIDAETPPLAYALAHAIVSPATPPVAGIPALTGTAPLRLALSLVHEPAARYALTPATPDDLPATLQHAVPAYRLNLAVASPSDPAFEPWLTRLAQAPPRGLRLDASNWRA